MNLSFLYGRAVKLRALCLLLLLVFIHLNISANFSTNAPIPPKVNSLSVTIKVVDSVGQNIEGAVVIIDDNSDLIGNTTGEGLVSYELAAGSYQLACYHYGYIDYHGSITVEGTAYTDTITLDPSVHWTTSPTPAPFGISEKNGMRMAAAGDNLYFWTAYGGEPGTSDTGGLQDFYSYHTTTDTWQQLPDAPFSSTYGISTAYGKTHQAEDAIYIIKGYWSGQRTWFARYLIDGNQWESGLSSYIPWREDLGNQYNGDGFQNYPRNGAVMVYTDQGFIYLFPGSGYGYEKYDWYRYSIEEDQWEDMDALPHRQGPGNAAVWVSAGESGLDQDYLYVQFGISPSGNYTDAEFWRYGLTTETWENMADHAYGADDGSALVWDGSEYIYHSPGAYQEQSWDYGLSQKRELMRYHLPSNTWEAMEKAPYNHWGGWDDGGGMVLINNAIYAMKGGDDIAWAEEDAPAAGGAIPNAVLWKYLPGTEDFQLTVKQSQGNGSINLAEGTSYHPQGTTLAIEATPDNGWVLAKWLVNGVFYSAETSINLLMDESKTLQAIFSEQTTHNNEPTGFPSKVYAHKNKIFLHLEQPGAALEVYDMLGRKVYSDPQVQQGIHAFSPGVDQGIYIVRLSWEEQQMNTRVYLAPGN